MTPGTRALLLGLVLFAILLHWRHLLKLKLETISSLVSVLASDIMVPWATNNLPRYACLVSCAGFISLFLLTLPGAPLADLLDGFRLQERGLSPFFYNGPSLPASPTLPTWLATIDGDTSLAELNLPGTHGSVARFGGSTYECQSLSIRNQLELGIRWLDVRLRYDGKGALQAQHGRVWQQATFPQLLAEIDAFLEARPSEFVLLKIQQEKSTEGPRFGEAVERDLAASGVNLFKKAVNSAAQLPTLDELRGKVVLMPRFFTTSFGTIQYESLIAQDDYKVSLAEKRFAIASSFDRIAPVTNLQKDFPLPDALLPMARRWLSQTLARRKDDRLRKLTTQSLAYNLGLNINYFSLHNNRESPALAASQLNQLAELLSQACTINSKRGMILAFDFPSIDTVAAVVASN